MKLNPLDQVPATPVIFLFCIIFFILMPGLFMLITKPVSIADGIALGDATFNKENLLIAGSYILLGLGLWGIAGKYRPELEDIIAVLPSTAEIKRYLWLGVGMVISAMGFVYLFYYPLSFIFPDFVESWYLDTPNVLFWDESSWYLSGNLATLVSAVILAPVIEEYLFRGFLLNRFSLLIGVPWAIIISSALFAILHTDIVGAFIFAVLMCFIYMQTRSLVGPILVHFSNNLFASVLEFIDLQWISGFEETTVADFQALWWLGLVCLIVGSLWLWQFAKQYLKPASEIIAFHEKGFKATIDVRDDQLVG
ncbi:CPBP family intramembrane glutamic endopeptidase [Thiolinea disciformis]|uniref:CPBP family intramembrane glutamic endopeptidase n=1 Tax=Thiolinea disciformis TaxID=125614 RepID=UPI0003659858|nr:CPBP family intramembrane glutamic endopeptidase [Thiolinea disciformis]